MAVRAVLSLLACVFAFAACGGGSDGDEAAEVEETIVTTAKSDDPAGCTRLLTMHYLEQSTKLQGEAAVTACEEPAIRSGG
jgi:ABC-type glycerol-3-phosphate transport system substrate-binding protein